VARNSDMIVMMLDSGKSQRHREILEKELRAVGIRLNERPADIYFKAKPGGGIVYTATCKVTHLTEGLVKVILQEFGAFWFCLRFSLFLFYVGSTGGYLCLLIVRGGGIFNIIPQGFGGKAPCLFVF
jgi:hypothetical protein